MKKDWSAHFLMTAEDVKAYVEEKLRYFDTGARLVCSEIGDGNINYVFKVTDECSGRSIVVKQADARLRSSGRPLDLHRSKIEATALAIQCSLVPSMVPRVYDYDDTMCALCMEDISAYRNLRTEMMSGHIFPKFAEQISDFLAATLLLSTDLVLDRAEKKERVRLFTNSELCDISEDLVFTEPYYDYKKRNIITEGNEAFVETRLYRNEALKTEVGILRNTFMNNAQTLLHGDLHSGSIFINESGLKIIDPEFAFYGPMGYDIGNVVGNLFFALAHKTFSAPLQTDFIGWVEKTIADVIDMTERKLSRLYDEIVTFPLYNAAFKTYYLEQVMADVLGFAGTEIIRRVVGDTKVAELSSIKELSVRIPMERALILTGEMLIMERRISRSGADAVRRFAYAVKSAREK